MLAILKERTVVKRLETSIRVKNRRYFYVRVIEKGPGLLNHLPTKIPNSELNDRQPLNQLQRLGKEEQGRRVIHLRQGCRIEISAPMMSHKQSKKKQLFLQP